MPKLIRINVVFVYVSDLARARDFYENTLGFGSPITEDELWVEYSLGEGSDFALHKCQLPAKVERTHGRCVTKLSIVVDDLQSAYDELRGKGIRITTPPERAFGFDYLELEDPDGNPLRLLQFTPPTI